MVHASIQLSREHVPACEKGYDPNSPEQLAARQKYDVRLLPPEERAAVFKERADAAFKQRNYRTAYLEYTRAIEATPDNHVLLGNRCQTYIKVDKREAALLDAERAISLAPDWGKGHYRHGVCLQLAERFEEAVSAFERAAQLEQSVETTKALEAANAKLAEWRVKQDKLAKSRKRTTIRQSADQYEEEKYAAKLAATKAGKIKSITEWGGELAEQFEQEYRANLRPPAGVEFALTYKPPVEGAAADGEPEAELCLEGNEENCEEGEEGMCELALEENAEEGGDGFASLLEDNIEEVAPDDSDDDSDDGDSSDTVSMSESDDDEAAREAAALDDSKWVPQPEDGDTRITLPPRNYTLVHEDGRLHTKDDFEPMSFGMQRIHNDDEPEPVWVQTKTARWLQTATDLTVIPWTVPKELCKGSAIKVSFARRQVHVQATESKEIFMAGELEAAIDPNTSTWTTDGQTITIVLVKENLLLWNGAKGKEADSHWHRLFTTDQYTERGMIAANYYDIPETMRRKNKMAELQRKDKEEKEKQANMCPLCGKDVRFFCDCRLDDKDYERPLPQGWKDSKLGFEDNYDKYSLAEPSKLKESPPAQPRPYQGRPSPKYGLDGKLQHAEPQIRMLKEGL